MVGPDYHRPKPIISARFKEQSPPPGWQWAQPKMAEMPKGKWWEVYHDPLLNQMEEQVAVSNQNVKAYEAQYRHAAAMIDSIRAQLFPTLNGSFQFNRNAQGISSRSAGSGSVVNYSSSITQNTWSTGPSASWTVDIWGKVRRQTEEQVRSTQASAAELAAMTLSYQTQLATDYFELRYLDSERDLLNRNVTYYEQAYQITKNQLDAGTADPTTALQARYQLETTRAQAIQTGVQRAQYEHAIAVLTGHAPADLTIPIGKLPDTLPAPPYSLPSVMLQRRPDIAEQERNVAAYNAEIGYQIAAFFPTITLTASFGYSGNPISQLIQLGTQTWALGAASTETYFQGGARTAAVRQAYADYDNAVAQYRQTVLSALQGTEDQLSNLRILGQQLQQQNIAVQVSQEAVRISTNEYLAGTQIYTTVVTAEQQALSNELTALSVREQQAVASVTLITDLGGGWDPSTLPSVNSLQTDNPFVPGFIQKDKNGARPPGTSEANGP